MSDDWGPVRNGLTTSYPEGASIRLTCIATAGRPLAKVRSNIITARALRVKIMQIEYFQMHRL